MYEYLSYFYLSVPPKSIDDVISPQTVYDSYSGPVDNVDIVKYPPHVG